MDTKRSLTLSCNSLRTVTHYFCSFVYDFYTNECKVLKTKDDRIDCIEQLKHENGVHLPYTKCFLKLHFKGIVKKANSGFYSLVYIYGIYIS